MGREGEEPLVGGRKRKGGGEGRGGGMGGFTSIRTTPPRRCGDWTDLCAMTAGFKGIGRESLRGN